MAVYEYYDVVGELIKNGVITREEIFDYTSYSRPDLYERFFQFCQENLSEKCVEYGYKIEPAKMYFSNEYSVNASASHGSVYYVIKFNMGTVHELYKLFCENDILNDPELTNYKQFERLIDVDQQVDFPFLMFQTAVQFTFYHELGHLIQFANKSGGKAMMAEQYTDAGATFDPLKHIMEYDADMHGGNSVAFHIMQFWNGLETNIKTDENLKKLLVVSLTGILGYIFFLWQTSNEDLYYDKHDHPHPLIRIVWIMLTLVETVKIQFNFVEHREIVSETLRMVDLYFKHIGRGDIKTRFMEPLTREYENILGYYQAVFRSSESIPFLAVNTVHKG